MKAQITEQMIVRDLVVKHPGLREVMEKLGVDYCCGGRHTLKEAAAEKGLDLRKILNGLNAALAAPAAPNDAPRDWSQAANAELINHIVNRHHAFLKEQLPRLEFILGKVLAAHGAHHGTELRALEAAFRPFKAELDQHMMKEENILFPGILQAESGGAGAFASWLQGPIKQMHVEHESAGQALKRMREATADYTLPADACPTYGALYSGLAALETDLHEHIHLENNILFPRMLES